MESHRHDRPPIADQHPRHIEPATCCALLDCLAAAVVVLTGTWITAVAAVTGAIAIIAAPPALVFSTVVRIDREHQERRKRKRKAEKRSRAARALPITPDHAAPEAEHE